MAKYRTIESIDLKAVRQMYGLSQTQLATKSNTEPTLLSRIERDKRIASIDTWARIIKVIKEEERKLNNKVRKYG